MDEEPIVLAVLREGALAAFEPAAAIAGVRLAVVGSCATARAWLVTWPRPRAAIVDLDLPNGDPLDLIEDLTATEGEPLPVLAVGGAAADRAAALARGASDFAGRPFELEDLGLRVGHLAARRSAPVVAAPPDFPEFVSALAHELINPLAASLGHAELAILEGVSPAARASLEAAIDAGRRAAAIVRALESYQSARLPDAIARALRPGTIGAPLGLKVR